MTDKKHPQIEKSDATTDNIYPKIEKNPAFAYLNSSCKQCQAERRPPPCPGHASLGGGGGGGGDEEPKSKKEGGSTGKSETTSARKEKVLDDTTTNKFGSKVVKHDIRIKNIIKELLANHLISIENNPDLGRLTIKCQPRLLTAQQKADFDLLLLAIQHELAKFKRAHGNGLNILPNNQGNSLTIQASNPKFLKLYGQFITQLINANLMVSARVSARALQQQKREEQSTHKARTPFDSMRTGPRQKND